MYQKPYKTQKNRKKPVETEGFALTKRLEKAKVNCGTVLRTRMNTEDCVSLLISGPGEQTREVYFYAPIRSKTWQRA